MEEERNRGLGKGLSELLGEARAKAAVAKKAKEDISTQQVNQAKHIEGGIEDEFKDVISASESLTDEKSVTRRISNAKREAFTELPVVENNDDFATIPSMSSDNTIKRKSQHKKNTRSASRNQSQTLDINENSNDISEIQDLIHELDEFNRGVPGALEQEVAPAVQRRISRRRAQQRLTELEENENIADVKKGENLIDKEILPSVFLDDEFEAVSRSTSLKTNVNSDTYTEINLEKNGLKAELLEAELPEAELPEAELPEAELPEAELPEAELPEAELPKVESSEVVQNIDTDISSGASPMNMQKIHELPIELINPNPSQPRKYFNEELLSELAKSIEIYGIIQPIIVNEHQGEYIIVGGERRWRAAHIAGLKQVPAIIKNYSDSDTLEVALIENIQRADLSPLDEAKAYAHLIKKYEFTQSELAQKIGKSRSHIANMIRLLDLNEHVRHFLDRGELTIGHARALIGVKNAENWAKKIISDNISVRKLEMLINQSAEKDNSRLPKAFNGGKNSDILALEADLKAALGVAVKIKAKSNQQGDMLIRYDSLEQLDEICRRLCSNWGNEHG